MKLYLKENYFAFFKESIINVVCVLLSCTQEGETATHPQLLM